MIGVFVLLMFFYMLIGDCCNRSSYEEYRTVVLGTNSVSHADTNAVPSYVTFVEVASKQKEDFRKYCLSLLQTILVNVLLPVLTALLGYIFGSKTEAEA